MVWYAGILIYLWELLKLWSATIFATPFKNLDMLWLLVPVWLAWFFAEFFQEKQGTSMGNAISNAVVVMWGSIDWARQTVHLISSGAVSGFGNISLRFILAAAVLSYGILIIVMGVRGNKVIEYVGRIREVTYVFVMFTPIFYNTIPFSFKHMIAAILFFPLFYYIIEMIDWITPNPKAIEMDTESASKTGGFSEMPPLETTPEFKMPETRIPPFSPSPPFNPNSPFNPPRY
jgi:hypothetical protein